jgi:ribosomal protein S15P/S13E
MLKFNNSENQMLNGMQQTQTLQKQTGGLKSDQFKSQSEMSAYFDKLIQNGPAVTAFADILVLKDQVKYLQERCNTLEEKIGEKEKDQKQTASLVAGLGKVVQSLLSKHEFAAFSTSA